MLLRLLLCVAVTLTTPSVAAVPSNTISCTGAFAADSSHARLVATFGRRNVVHQPVEEEGFSVPASIVFLRDESRRIVFNWHDEKHRRYPKSMTLSSPSSTEGSIWKLENGVQLGMSLVEVERLNGRPFSLTGFGWDGIVTDWHGGALQDKMGACEVLMWFGTSYDVATSPYAFPGNEGPYLSSDPAMRGVKPTLDAIELRYER